MEYFSDQERSPKQRTEEVIRASVWQAILTAITSRISNGSFGNSYPLPCSDGGMAYGTDWDSFWQAAKGEISNLELPVYAGQIPSIAAVLDLVQFCYLKVAKAIPQQYHEYFKHTHLSFDVSGGRADFRDEINRILARNGLAYALETDGRVMRLLPAVLGEVLSSSLFRTGDSNLDSLLEAARTKFLSPDLNVRKDALEKLWDAFERLKTLEPGKDKAESATKLLEAALPEPQLRARIDEECKTLTKVGNDFTIRHHEVGKTPISRSEDVDYLFHRLFALIRLLLRSTNRGG